MSGESETKTINAIPQTAPPLSGIPVDIWLYEKLKTAADDQGVSVPSLVRSLFRKAGLE